MPASKRRRSQLHDTRAEPPSVKAGVSHDWEKDDEELELEAALFGRSKKRRDEPIRGRSAATVQGEGDEEKGVNDLEDDELFTIDAPVMGRGSMNESEDDEEATSEEGSDGEGYKSSVDYEDEDEEDASSDDGAEEFEPQVDDAYADHREEGHADDDVEISFPADLQSPSPAGAASASSSRSPSPASHAVRERKPLWVDPADAMISVSLIKDKRMRKLARGRGGKVNGSASGEGEGVGMDGMVDGRELEKRLREQFERLHPRPEWASNRMRPGTPALSSLLRSTKSFIAPPTSSDILHHGKSSSKNRHRPNLPQGTIEVHRLLDANHQNPTTGKREASNAGNGVVDLAWHPSSKVGVLAVAGGDRRLRFFNIDGHTNAALLTIHLPSLPLERATFHPSGTSLLLTGTRPYYYTYDLISSRCLRSPRDVFGSAPTPTSPNSLTRHSFSPDGSMLAVAGRRGAVSILDWSGSGVGAVIAELRSGRGGSVADLRWSGQGELSVLGGRDGSEVEVWDVGARRIKRKWRDDRCFGGSVMRLSDDGAYTAVGSSTGIVNLYESSSLGSTPKSSTANLDINPEPLKSLEQITTPITSLAFHPSSQLLVTASNTKRNRMKLYHLPTGTAYSNWPTQTTPLGRVNALGFSAGGEYLATGNQRGKVLLYSLKHFVSV